MPSQSHLQDRKWLENDCLPKLRGSVLFVGVRKYNRGYQNLVPCPLLFETVDPDPKQAKYGSRTHHCKTAESLLSGGGYCYDHVVAYGLIGMRDSLRSGKEEIVTMLKTLIAVATRSFVFGGSTDTVSMQDLNLLLELAGLARWHTHRNFVVSPSPQHSDILIRWSVRQGAHIA